MADMKVRKCGCIRFEYGPPVLCVKHERKYQLEDEKALRKAAREAAERLGHKLGLFSEYESERGKWTAFCEHCGLIVICYDEPQPHLEAQVFGWALQRTCSGN